MSPRIAFIGLGVMGYPMTGPLKYKGYDHKAIWGDGKHTGIHGGAILPESLRWLWRDTK